MAKTIKIDRDKCIGCGKCVNACSNNVIELKNGKAEVTGPLHCDGLGVCIGQCPVDAIEFVETEAAAKKQQQTVKGEKAFQCPGTKMMQFERDEKKDNTAKAGDVESRLGNWPVQLALVSPDAEYFKGADLLIAADCSAFAFGAFHSELLDGRKLMIACPKLDDRGLYLDKLTELFKKANPQSVSVVIMEVPCCRGLIETVYLALVQAGVKTKVQEYILSVDGQLVKKKTLDDSLILAEGTV